MMKRLLVLILMMCCASVYAAREVVNLYTWSGYVPQVVIDQFQQETGIRVSLSEYDSNEDLYAKLKSAPHSGYDLVMPSSYYVSRMRREGMLMPLKQSALPNKQYQDPMLLNKKFDLGNLYSYPYLWGTTGIVVDDRYWDPKSIRRWRDLWQPRFRNQLLLYDDYREVFGMGMLAAGHPINEQSQTTIHAVFKHLKQLMPNVRLFSSDVVISAFADNDVTVGMMENSDYVLAHSANPHLVYIFPKDGFAMWQDCMVIPRYAPHLKNALKLMNFLMRPDIAYEIVINQGGSTPNLKTRKMLPLSDQHNPAMYPSAALLKRAQMESDIGTARSAYIHYWQLLKLSS